MANAGNGPACPVNPRHGRTYSWDRDRGRRPGHDYYCPHSDHGGNGRFFSDAEANGAYQITEDDIMNILESAARDVVAGTVDLDTAVSQVAKATKRGSAQVREQISETVAAIQAAAEQKTAEKAAEKESRMAKKAETKTERPPRERKEHVEPTEFAAVRDRLNLRNKEVAAALQAAGMGATLSRVTELTHSKGSSRDLFVKFEAALVAYREANPYVAPVAEEPAPKPARKAKAAKTEEPAAE